MYKKIEENVGKYFEWDDLAEENLFFVKFFYCVVYIIIFIVFIMVIMYVSCLKYAYRLINCLFIVS